MATDADADTFIRLAFHVFARKLAAAIAHAGDLLLVDTATAFICRQRFVTKLKSCWAGLAIALK
ncbi:hypothetical protein PQR62_10320 [Herbaspirillum lusitanum]|uniref:Uncharacterized protein n=1 Tax=Herbaspirillum lusitanum TaxID=213312 RepID=A0ABW9AB85_9BURK